MNRRWLRAILVRVDDGARPGRVGAGAGARRTSSSSRSPSRRRFRSARPRRPGATRWRRRPTEASRARCIRARRSRSAIPQRELFALRDGAADLAVGSALAWSAQLPALAVYAMPWIAPEREDLDALVASPAVAGELMRRTEAIGVVLLALAPLGHRTLVTTSKVDPRAGRPRGPPHPRDRRPARRRDAGRAGRASRGDELRAGAGCARGGHGSTARTAWRRASSARARRGDGLQALAALGRVRRRDAVRRASRRLGRLDRRAAARRARRRAQGRRRRECARPRGGGREGARRARHGRNAPDARRSRGVRAGRGVGARRSGPRPSAPTSWRPPSVRSPTRGPRGPRKPPRRDDGRGGRGRQRDRARGGRTRRGARHRLARRPRRRASTRRTPACAPRSSTMRGAVATTRASPAWSRSTTSAWRRPRSRTRRRASRDAADTLARGVVIAFANRGGRALGVVAGMPCREAADRLRGAPLPAATLRRAGRMRARCSRPATARGADRGRSTRSALSTLRDAGAVLVIGSHGALHGGDPASALRVDAAGGVLSRCRAAGATMPVLAPAGPRCARHRRGDGRSPQRAHRRRALDVGNRDAVRASTRGRVARGSPSGMRVDDAARRLRALRSALVDEAPEAHRGLAFLRPPRRHDQDAVVVAACARRAPPSVASSVPRAGDAPAARGPACANANRRS